MLTAAIRIVCYFCNSVYLMNSWPKAVPQKVTRQLTPHVKESQRTGGVHALVWRFGKPFLRSVCPTCTATVLWGTGRPFLSGPVFRSSCPTCRVIGGLCAPCPTSSPPPFIKGQPQGQGGSAPTPRGSVPPFHSSGDDPEV